MNRVTALRTYKDGVKDRDGGLSHLENPFDIGTEEYLLWFRGWAGAPDPRVAPQFVPTTTGRTK